MSDPNFPFQARLKSAEEIKAADTRKVTGEDMWEKYAGQMVTVTGVYLRNGIKYWITHEGGYYWPIEAFIVVPDIDESICKCIWKKHPLLCRC